MKYKLRGNLNQIKILIWLSLFSLVFGALTVLVGDIFMPIYTGVLATLILFDKSSKRFLSAGISLSVIVLAVVLGNYIPSVQFFSALIAVLIYCMFVGGKSKGECVGYSTAISTLMIIVSLVAVAFFAKGSFSKDAVVSFYTNVYGEIKNIFLENYFEMIKSLPAEVRVEAVSEEQITLLLNSFVMMVPSMLVIVAFIMTGISFKIFSTVASKIIDKPEQVFNWRFSTSSIFACFYIILMVLSIFARNNDVFGLVVSNLYNVFLFVYAYIGFNFVRAIIMQRRSLMFSTLILIVLIFLMSGFALTVLSVLGVYFTIVKNKSLIFNEKNK